MVQSVGALSNEQLNEALKSKFNFKKNIGEEYSIEDIRYVMEKDKELIWEIDKCSDKLLEEDLVYILGRLNDKSRPLPRFLYKCAHISTAFRVYYEERRKSTDIKLSEFKKVQKKWKLNSKDEQLAFFYELRNDPVLIMALDSDAKNILLKNNFLSMYARDLSIFPVEFFTSEIKDELIRLLDEGVYVEPPLDIYADEDFAQKFEEKRKEVTLRSGKETINYPSLYRDIRVGKIKTLKEKGHLYIDSDLFRTFFESGVDFEKDFMSLLPEGYKLSLKDYEYIGEKVYSVKALPRRLKAIKEVSRVFISKYPQKSNELPLEILSDSKFVSEMVKKGLWNQNTSLSKDVLCSKSFKEAAYLSLLKYPEYRDLIFKIPHSCQEYEKLYTLFDSHPSYLKKVKELPKHLIERYKDLGTCWVSHLFEAPYSKLEGISHVESFVMQNECEKLVKVKVDKSVGTFVSNNKYSWNCSELIKNPEPKFYSGFNITFKSISSSSNRYEALKQWRCPESENIQTRIKTEKYLDSLVKEKGLARCFYTVRYTQSGSGARGVNMVENRVFIHPDLMSKAKCLSGDVNFLMSMSMAMRSVNEDQLYLKFGSVDYQANSGSFSGCNEHGLSGITKRWGFAGNVIAQQQAENEFCKLASN